MSLGQKIYQFRTATNFSQGDLAEILGVSRQSVSKWETDASIPDLDKLIKMCEVFGTTLDELTGRNDSVVINKSINVKQPTINTVHTVGIILLVSTIITNVLLVVLADNVEDFYIPLPILLTTLICSIICIAVKYNAAYWCTWAILVPISNLSLMIVGLPVFTTTLISQIILFTVMSIFAYKNINVFNVKSSKKILVLALLAFVIGVITYFGLLFTISFDWLTMCIFVYVYYAAFAILLTYSVCCVKAIIGK